MLIVGLKRGPAVPVDASLCPAVRHRLPGLFLESVLFIQGMSPIARDSLKNILRCAAFVHAVERSR